jgi:DsbC/DsbD-like thiol-disulfide interchange protein
MNAAANRRARIWPIAVLCLLSAASALAQPADAPHLRVDLVAEKTSLAPGRTAKIGLHFQLEKHWHIYWINPGDSGQPPNVRWTLPPGFAAGAILWPAPVRLGTASVADYGYEDEVLLMLPLRVPPTLKPGGTATLAATVKWLVCSDICIPGHADLTLTLPVRTSPSAPSVSAALIEKTRAALPKPAPRNWKVTSVSDGNDFLISIDAGAALPQGVFFPLVPEQIENSAPQKLQPFPRGLRLTLRKSDQLQKLPATLRGVLVLSPGRAFEISAPLGTSGPPGAKLAKPLR